jgi:hypothetical protein
MCGALRLREEDETSPGSVGASPAARAGAGCGWWRGGFRTWFFWFGWVDLYVSEQTGPDQSVDSFSSTSTGIWVGLNFGPAGV